MLNEGSYRVYRPLAFDFIEGRQTEKDIKLLDFPLYDIHDFALYDEPFRVVKFSVSSVNGKYLNAIHDSDKDELVENMFFRERLKVGGRLAPRPRIYLS